MPAGTLEVLLISAKGLENTDYLCNMDPYVTLTCRSQEKKSSVASGKGSDPEWNETFVFTISDGAEEIILKILDSDSGTQDDFVGQVTIPLEPVYIEKSLPATAYNVVKDEEYCGEIRVGLTFLLRRELKEILKGKKLMVDGSSLIMQNENHHHSMIGNRYPIRVQRSHCC